MIAAFDTTVISGTVNIKIDNSLILKEPSNDHHYGGLRERFDVDNPAHRYKYDHINWVIQGAPEN